MINKVKFIVDVYCKHELGVESDFFIYDGEKYKVCYRMTYNSNINNKGTSFVVGSLITNPTDYLKVKSFLITEWVK